MGLRHFLPVAFAASLVACTALTGTEDFYLAVDSGLTATPNDAGVDATAVPTDAATDAPLVCPRGLSDCNADRSDGCEIDTLRDEKNCGSCSAACTVPGSLCVNGTCSPPPASCKALLAVAPGSPSGSYMLDVDGNGPSPAFSATCDMTTAGGGWTLVFAPTTFVNDTTALDYTIENKAVLGTADEALLAYRDAAGAVLGTTAAIGMPSEWKSAAPFRLRARDVNVSVRLNGGSATSATLRYGYAYFHSMCTDDWDETREYGRLCLAGTTAPFFAGFSSPGNDTCSDSSKSYNQASCSGERRFTIGVR